MCIKAIIFDLDGVIVSTDEYHYLAWKALADKEGIYFNEEINNKLRGISRKDCLDILLSNTDREYSEQEKETLASEKNEIYKRFLKDVTPNDILLGVKPFLKVLKSQNIKVAVGSSSENAAFVLDKTNLADYFDAVADGTEITRSKPDPEVFLVAAKKLEVAPSECIVIEDAAAGIDAALAAGMYAVGVGAASGYHKAHYKLKDLSSANLNMAINHRRV